MIWRGKYDTGFFQIDGADERMLTNDGIHLIWTEVKLQKYISAFLRTWD